MKTLSILPLLAVGATNRNNQNGDERGFDGSGLVSNITDYSEDCSDQVPNKGGIFETTNSGNRGELTLDKYSTKLRCKHVVQADDRCSEIKISYRNIAVNAYYNGVGECTLDAFRFGWGENGTEELTPPRCNCFGEGCSHDIMGDHFDNINDYYGLNDDHLGPAEFTIPSNNFTFYFESAMVWDFGPNGDLIPFSVDGHVILDWECVETELSTTTIEPTTFTTTTAFTTTT